MKTFYLGLAVCLLLTGLCPGVRADGSKAGARAQGNPDSAIALLGEVVGVNADFSIDAYRTKLEKIGFSCRTDVFGHVCTPASNREAPASSQEVNHIRIERVAKGEEHYALTIGYSKEVSVPVRSMGKNLGRWWVADRDVGEFVDSNITEGCDLIFAHSRNRGRKVAKLFVFPRGGQGPACDWPVDHIEVVLPK